MNESRLKEYIAAGLSTRTIAKTHNCSQTNVRHWLKKYGLKTSPHVAPHCGQCGEEDPAKFYGNKKHVCGKCHNKYTSDKGRILKQKARDYLGGRCVSCGFDKYSVALDIHHTDPSSKDPNFVSMRSWNWVRVEAELRSCILLCKNCHAALHAGLIEIKQRGM